MVALLNLYSSTSCLTTSENSRKSISASPSWSASTIIFWIYQECPGKGEKVKLKRERKEKKRTSLSVSCIPIRCMAALRVKSTSKETMEWIWSIDAVFTWVLGHQCVRYCLCRFCETFPQSSVRVNFRREYSPLLASSQSLVLLLAKLYASSLF